MHPLIESKMLFYKHVQNPVFHNANLICKTKMFKHGNNRETNKYNKSCIVQPCRNIFKIFDNLYL